MALRDGGMGTPQGAQPQGGPAAQEDGESRPRRQWTRLHYDSLRGGRLPPASRDAPHPPRRSPPSTSQPFVRLVAENGRTPSSLHLTSEGATSEPASLKGAMLPIGCLAIPPAPSSPACACAALGLPGQRGAEVFCSPRGLCELALAVLRPQTSGFYALRPRVPGSLVRGGEIGDGLDGEVGGAVGRG